MLRTPWSPLSTGGTDFRPIVDRHYARHSTAECRCGAAVGGEPVSDVWAWIGAHADFDKLIKLRPVVQINSSNVVNSPARLATAVTRSRSMASPTVAKNPC